MALMGCLPSSCSLCHYHHHSAHTSVTFHPLVTHWLMTPAPLCLPVFICGLLWAGDCSFIIIIMSSAPGTESVPKKVVWMSHLDDWVVGWVVDVE